MQKVWHRDFDSWWYATVRESGIRKHVKYWVKKKGYNSTSANKFIGAIKRVFNWAVEEEHIAKSPIAHVRKPKSLSRDRILDPGERELIMGSIRDQAFRDYVFALQ